MPDCVFIEDSKANILYTYIAPYMLFGIVKDDGETLPNMYTNSKELAEFIDVLIPAEGYCEGSDVGLFFKPLLEGCPFSGYHIDNVSTDDIPTNIPFVGLMKSSYFMKVAVANRFGRVLSKGGISILGLNELNPFNTLVVI